MNLNETKKRFAAAVRMAEQGNNDGAIDLFFEIFNKTIETDLKYQAVFYLVGLIQHPKTYSRLIPVCDEGIKLAEKMKEPARKAYLQARKALFLTHMAAEKNHASRNLNLAKGWTGFSLERERELFETLSKELEAMEASAEILVAEARAWAKESSGESEAARVLVELGSVQAVRYLNQKMKWLRDSKVDRLMRRLNFETHFGFSRGERRKLRGMKNLCLNIFQEAVVASRKTGDEEMEAFSRYNHGLWLKTFYRFKSASRQISLAKGIAERKNIQELLGKIPIVEQSIRMRNRDIPNYAEGESR